MKGSRNVVLGETVKAASLVPATWADVGKRSYDAAVGKVGIRSSLAGQLPSRRYRERRATRFTAIGGSLLLTVIGITACSGGPPQKMPRFVSLAQASFQAGKGGLFAIQTLNARGPIIEDGSLPAGLAMHHSAGGTVISGVPSGASGGVYHVTLSVAGPTGRPTRQRLAILVYQAPRLLVGSTSQWSAASQHMTFNMTATGYPIPRITLAGKLPPALTFRSSPGIATISGHLNVSWLKAVLAGVLGVVSAVIAILTGGQSALFEFGAGTISSGLRNGALHLIYTSSSVTAVASNGVGSPSSVILTMRVLGPN